MPQQKVVLGELGVGDRTRTCILLRAYGFAIRCVTIPPRQLIFGGCPRNRTWRAFPRWSYSPLPHLEATHPYFGRRCRIRTDYLLTYIRRVTAGKLESAAPQNVLTLLTKRRNFGCLNWTRTSDLSLIRGMLYQLSYETVFFKNFTKSSSTTIGTLLLGGFNHNAESMCRRYSFNNVS